jgi:hypothetical protein
MTMSPNGNFLYHVGPNDIRIYLIDQSTGYLTLTEVYTNLNAGAGPLIIDPAVKFAYIPQVTYPTPTTVSYSLAGFTVDRTNGSLAPIPGNETTFAYFPLGLAIVRPN